MSSKSTDTSLRKYNISLLIVIILASIMVTGVWWWYSEKEKQIEKQLPYQFR